MKRPRKIQLPTTKASPYGPGRQDSDEDGPWQHEEADHGRGYEGDTSSGSGCSLGRRSHRPRAGCRSRAGNHVSRSPDGGSEVNGLALVSGFKRLPRQYVQMKPVKSVLVRRRESEGEPAGVLVAVRLGIPAKGQSLTGCGRLDDSPKDIPGLVPGPVNMSAHVAKGLGRWIQARPLRWW